MGLAIRREGGPVYYFYSFGVVTPPLFLEEKIDLGSNERIQQYYESYCGAYCLYMTYLFNKGFRIKSASNILVNQCKRPGMYIKCLCLGCKGKGKVYQGTCFADDEVKVIDNANDNFNYKNKDRDNDNFNDNDNIDIKDNTNGNINVNDGKATEKPFHGWSKTHNVNDTVNDNDEI